MKKELQKDIQEYGFLLIILAFMVFGMIKYTKHVDKIAERYNRNQDQEYAQIKKEFKKH